MKTMVAVSGATIFNSNRFKTNGAIAIRILESCHDNKELVLGDTAGVCWRGARSAYPCCSFLLLLQKQITKHG
jgi:hypothetical protein